MKVFIEFLFEMDLSEYIGDDYLHEGPIAILAYWKIR